MTLTADAIAEIEALLSAATPSPWKWDKDASDGGAPVITASSCWRGKGRARVVAKAFFHDGSEDPEVHANAQLIVALVAHTKELLAAARYAERFRWVPVEERMPEDCAWVLGWRPDGYGVSMYLWDEDGWNNEGASPLRPEFLPTHWMPLPSPPEAGKREGGG